MEGDQVLVLMPPARPRVRTALLTVLLLAAPGASPGDAVGCDPGSPCEVDFGDLAAGPVVPPCTRNPWGTEEEARAIEEAMYLGSISEARAAVRAARRTRGVEVGCGERALERAAPDHTPPDVEAVESSWERTYLPALAGYPRSGCPPIGREWPAAALAGEYALLAGLPAPELVLARIVEDVVGTQYGTAHAPEPLVTFEGLYGYAESLGDRASPCRRRGSVGRTIARLCALGPSVCPRYDAGPWSGSRFVVVDFLTEPRVFDGGAAYDHGWSAAAVLQASLAAAGTDAARWRDSALAAARWSAAEPAVRNHNYTAKNVWVLALTYELTGDRSFRAAMMDKVRRNLLPGVLVDRDRDGEVDGLDGVRFADLARAARLPGRMWDAHNAMTWYHSMNTWAMAEAYVALRERGDVSRAARLRPYALAMLDNLAGELLDLGPPLAGGAQHEPIPYALAVGSWKIADAEGEAHDDWSRAFATLWNAGYFEEPGFRRAAALMTYLLHRRGVAFVSSVRSEGSER